MERHVEATGNVLRDRVRAWWYGVEIPQLYEIDAEEEARRAEAEAEQAAAALAAASGPREEPIDRLDLLQAVWGPGYLQPGGIDYILTLVKPFGFNPAMSILDLTVGLGGPARNIAEKFNIYINGMERDGQVAARGRAAMVKGGMARRVLISDYDPEALELRAHSFDGIYGQHLLGAISDKEKLLREVKKALKSGGHFTFTDFVLSGARIDDPALKPWFDAEPQPLVPWTAAQYVECLTRVGLDCRISESQGALYAGQVSAAWNRYLRSVSVDDMSRENQRLVLSEATLSTHRAALIGKGMIDLQRFYAIVY
jgi:SAM-dependent methyltransferase